MEHANSIKAFIKHHYRHFNGAALVDAAEGYRRFIADGGQMFLAMAGAMSTAELGLSLAEMIAPARSTPSVAPARIWRKTSTIWWPTTTTCASPTTAT
ncbi:MAG: hypothetical protein R2838_06110 [Caldilineaceae bacterium]